MSKGASKYRLDSKTGLLIPRNKMAKRGYSAAGDAQLLYEWATNDRSANSEIRHKLKRLMGMARDLETDNEYVGRWLYKHPGPNEIFASALKIL